MGLTPEQIAGVMHQDNANAAQAVALMQLPADMALKQAQLRAAERKEPTIPVETPYGVVNMTTDQAMRVADQTANRSLREEALALQRANAAASAETRALMAGIAGQNAQTARERLAETKANNLTTNTRAKEEQLDRDRNNILRHIETYSKNPKGTAAMLASSINQASSQVMPEMVFLDDENKPHSIDPSVFNLGNNKYTKETIQENAAKAGVPVTTYLKTLVNKYGDMPGFTETFETTKIPFR